MTKDLVRRFLCLLAAAAAIQSRQTFAIEQESGRFAELVARLASKQYVLGAPQHDSRPYVDPAPVLNAFRHVAAAMAWGDVKVAARKARELDYEVVEFTDSETKRNYFVLREDLDVVKAIRGWGSYVINPQSRVAALIEVPHPFADVHTPEIGGEVFARSEARGFLLAGTHRDKADVPDLVDSIFHQVHTAWIGPFAQVTAWQIHGFLGMKHPFPRGTQVVASTGDGAIVPEMATLDNVMEKRGLESYVFNQLPADARENKQINGGVPGMTFTSLAAAKNEQGRLSRSLGGSFVHIELESDVRANEQTRTLASAAIATVVRDATALAEVGQRERAELAATAEPLAAGLPAVAALDAGQVAESSAIPLAIPASVPGPTRIADARDSGGP